MATHWPHRGSMIDPGVASSMFCLDARLKCPNGRIICPNGHDYVFTTRRGPNSPLQFTADAHAPIGRAVWLTSRAGVSRLGTLPFLTVPDSGPTILSSPGRSCGLLGLPVRFMTGPSSPRRGRPGWLLTGPMVGAYTQLRRRWRDSSSTTPSADHVRHRRRRRIGAVRPVRQRNLQQSQRQVSDNLFFKAP